MPTDLPHNLRLTLSNYRCFTGERPFTLRLLPGATALVGVNNSGKSTAIKALYELRPFLQLILRGEQLSAFIRGNRIVTDYLGVEDPAELLHNGNLEDCQITIQWESSHGPNDVCGMRIVVPRSSPDRPHLQLWSSVTPEPLTDAGHDTIADDSFRQVTAGNSQYNASFRSLFDTIRFLRDSLYLPPFRNAVTEARAEYYDMRIGTAFVQLWHQWKTGPERNKNNVVQNVTSVLTELFGAKRIEINAANQEQTLQIVLDNHPFRLRELGSGFAQLLMILATTAVRSPSLLLFDEPELHLHASLQLRLFEVLSQFHRGPTVFATHSLGLARSVADRVLSIQRTQSGPHAVPFGEPRHMLSLLGELSYSGYQGLGVRGVLLVEGVNDIKTVSAMLRLFGKDAAYVILPLGGDQFLAAGRVGELAELKRLADTVHVLIDSERQNENSASPAKRVQFVRDCASLDIPVHMTSLRSLESYFTAEAVRAAHGSGAMPVGPFDVHEEQRHRWAKEDGWRAVGYMEQADLQNTDLGAWLATL